MINPLILHFRAPDEFEQYLGTLRAPLWFKKVAVHHTAVPTVKQWRGRGTMNGMLDFYRGKGWTGFPHIYVAPDGIWTMNNLLLKGVHTNAANSFAIGVEVVGNYDNTVWQEPIYSYAVETITSLQRWGRLATNDIVLHRTYNPEKTCPGKAITFDWVVAQLTKYQESQEGKVVTYRVLFNNSYIRQGPSRAYAVAGKMQRGDTFTSVALKDDERGEDINGKKKWAHVTKAIETKEGVDNLGFIHLSMLEVIG